MKVNLFFKFQLLYVFPTGTTLRTGSAASRVCTQWVIDLRSGLRPFLFGYMFLGACRFIVNYVQLGFLQMQNSSYRIQSFSVLVVSSA